METGTGMRALRILSWVAAGLYVVVGIGELIFAGDSLAHRVFFLAVLTLFAVLVVVGVREIDTRPWVGAGMATLGAILGGFSLFWTVVAVVLAIAIVVLSVICARRLSAAPA